MDDTTLTMDKLMAACRLGQPLARPIGLQVIVSHNLPKQNVGTWIVPAHPLVRWMTRRWPWRLLRPSPWVQCGPIMRDCTYRMGDKLIVSPAAYAAMRQL